MQKSFELFSIYSDYSSPLLAKASLLPLRGRGAEGPLW